MDSEELIENQDNVINCITKTVGVYKIYIYGSYARCKKKGKIRSETEEDYDVDMYIILMDEDILQNMSDKIEISFKIKQKLIENNLYFGMGLLLGTKNSYNKRKNINGCIEYVIEREGICIYDRGL